MRQFKNKDVKLLLVIGIVMIIVGALFINNIESRKEISSEDQENTETAVKTYYSLIENGNYELAVFHCNFKDEEIDIESRLRALYEVNGSIIEELSVIDSENQAYYYEDKKSIAYNISINLKYKNTLGGATKEIVLLSKVDGKWKIDTIIGLDRYGYYRAPNYEQIRLLDFLDPRKGS